MADWSGEGWRWLCGRGRRPNFYAVITTLFLVVVAVQRRGSSDDDGVIVFADQRRHQSVPNLSGGLEQQSPVIGVFLLVNLDDIDDRQWNQTHSISPAQCSREDTDYRVYLLLFTHNASKHAGRLRQLVGDHVTGRVGVCAKSDGATNYSTDVRVAREAVITDGRRDLRTLNLVMTDAYLHDNVDYFYVVYDAVKPSDIGLFDGSSILSIRHLRHLANVLRDDMTLPDTGIILGFHRSIFLSRTHFHIFGFFFPIAVPRISTAVSVVLDLYRSVNLTSHVVAPTSTGSDVIVIPGSRNHGAGDVITPAKQWSEVFEQAFETLQRYIAVASKSKCLYCPETSPSREQRVISMSLYGSERRYVFGAVRNAQLRPVVFPGWRIRFYCKSSGLPSSRYGAVAAGVVKRLRQLGAQVRYVDGGSGRRLAPMMWRFTVVEDPDVDVFIVRDADSRLTPRDAAVVADWLGQEPETAAIFHCIRDHPAHSDSFINGGLWGARRQELFARFNGSFSTAMLRYSGRYNDDMAFLNRRVWPQVKRLAVCHDSVSCRKFPASLPFPVERQGTEHVGQRYDELTTGNRDDIHELARATVDYRCVPTARDRRL